MSDEGIPSGESGERQVLLVHEDVATMRLVREALESFTVSTVDTSPNAVYAFERSLQKRYDLFVFSLSLPEIHGELLYELIAKAYQHCHAGSRTAPAIIYLGEQKHSARVDELQRDARVKGVVMRPIRLDTFLKKAHQVLPAKDPSQV